ncbi:hypothetical protein ACFVVX_06850 [Kitasatospora sp. NPDC058170]|uniref:hypothetical protein n=1 Tax=Kitasatospora sp. NPDC058170 TaxID=3346364 RepID=UPI0036DD3189
MPDIKVGRELRDSAGVSQALGEEFATPITAALTAAKTASGQLAGWSVAGALDQLGTGWAAPLDQVRQRLASTATKLVANADAHDRNEQAIAGAWKGGVE